MYATGSATTIIGLLDTMMAFAVANAGMTEVVRRSEDITVYDPSIGYVPKTVTVVCLNKAASYWWFAYSNDMIGNYIQGFLADSSGGSAWHVTGGVQSALSYVQPIVSPFSSYHLFTEGSVVHLAAEMSNGSWTHLNFGDVTKYGSWTGSSFLGVTHTGQSLSMHQVQSPYNGGIGFLVGNPSGNVNSDGVRGRLRCQVGARPYAAFGLNGDDGVNTPGTALGQVPGVLDTIIRDSPNQFNNRAMGPRMEVYAQSQVEIGGTGLWMPVGYIPNIRAINIQYLNPKDLVNTDWMVFPLQSKNSGLTNTYLNTLNLGWAVRK